MKLILKFATIPFGVFLSAQVATAQLDLPERPTPPPTEDGVDLPPAPRGDVAPGNKGSGQRGGLSLPGSRGGPVTPKEASGIAEIPAESGSVEALFNEVRKLKVADNALVKTSAKQLAEMGPNAWIAARNQLSDSSPSVIMTAARTLLLVGASGDRELIRQRLDRKVPSRVVGPLVDLLVETEPAATRQALVMDLAEGRYGSVRKQALDHLDKLVLGPSTLLQMKASNHTEVRALSYTKLARLDGVSAALMGGDDALNKELLAGLEDSSARVAEAASLGISSRISGPNDPLVQKLMRDYRLRDVDDHRGAQALVALIKAEERLGEALINEEEGLYLLIMMQRGTPFVRAATSTALAGIGFRSTQPSPWLDNEVTSTLISSIAGEEYYPEFNQIRDSSLRRLERITGQSFGDEGPLWKSWWNQTGGKFHALRAVLAIGPEDHVRLEVRFMDPLNGSAYRLLGPEAVAAEMPFPGPSLRLLPEDSARLLAALAKAGVLGADRLPGLHGQANGLESQLAIAVDQHSKAFRQGSGPMAEWLEPVLEDVAATYAHNEWQLFPLPADQMPEGIDYYAFEAPWWAAPRTELERDRHLASLILSNMRLHAPLDRTRHVNALKRLPDGTLGQEHFDALADRFQEEDYLGERARDLLALAEKAGLNGGTQLSDDDAGRLLDVLVSQGSSNRQPLLAEVARLATPAFARTLALDPRGDLRAVAANVLAHGDREPEDMALLRSLIVDSNPMVEAAAVLAVSDANLGEFRDSIYARARVADPIVRIAAIRGVGLMGGAGAVDILRLVVLYRDTEIKLAGAEALADLADPSGATLLSQMFASGERSPFFSAARRGLLAIGEPGWDDLLKIARTSSHPAGRSAMLLLAEQGVAEVMTTMLQVLTDNPTDAVMARELAMLTGVDYRMQTDPAREWWVWHDAKRDMTALEWFAEGANAWIDASGNLDLMASGLRFKAADLVGDGNEDGARALIEFIRNTPADFLELRALRELRRLLEESKLNLPPKGRMRDEWCDVLLTRLDPIFEGKRERRANTQASQAAQKAAGNSTEVPAAAESDE